jgi:hypothetical protein
VPTSSTPVTQSTASNSGAPVLQSRPDEKSEDVIDYSDEPIHLEAGTGSETGSLSEDEKDALVSFRLRKGSSFYGGKSAITG